MTVFYGFATHCLSCLLYTSNWKFSESDIAERAHWEEYQAAYQDAIRETSTKNAPWYIVPADKKWFARLLISQIIVETLQDIDPQYPELPEAKRALLQQCREQLLAEDKKEASADAELNEEENHTEA